MLEKKIDVCPEHKLVNAKGLMHWMANDYTFYYSCENCIKKRSCNKYNKVMNATSHLKGVLS